MSSIAAADGPIEVEIESLPTGWGTAKVTYETSDGTKKASIQIIDLRAKPPIQYAYDSMHVISVKCALLVIGIPFFAVINMGFHVVRTVVLVIGTFGRLCRALLEMREWKKVERLLSEWFQDTAEIVVRGSWDFVRCPILAFGMQLCCINGIFFPLEGRVWAGSAERLLKGSSRSYDMRRFSDVKVPLRNLFEDKDSPYCFFWAHCFQPIGPAVVQDGKNPAVKGKSHVTQIEWLAPGSKTQIHLE